MKKYILSQLNKKMHYKGMIIEPKIQNFLYGRIWIKDYAPFSSSKIETYIRKKLIVTLPGITVNNFFKWKQFKCNRCHNENQQQFVQFECAKCNEVCVYCRHCINMGRISRCTTLIVWNGPKPFVRKNHTFCWESQFTNEQFKAANSIVTSLNRKRHHLLHAVCGSGKTEMLFPAVHKGLNNGMRVCIATPRTDVVLELYPRFQKVFPNTNIHALYGNAPKQEDFAQLVIATTHQLYRFENAFDYCIVDEADAFPYTVDETLQKAVKKAKRKDAPTLFVTATPSIEILNKVKKEQWGYSFIPKRYHGYPLPVPRFEALWFYEKMIHRGILHKKLMKWTKNCLNNNQPFLIFFPSIELMEKAAPLFQKIDKKIESVHAEDPNRKEKVLNLRNGKVPGLLTTTILERGITIPNVQVAVVGSESPIFTSSALIQISGRVGRSAKYPKGDIVFFHHGISVHMDQAKEEIDKLNREGFLSVGQK